MSQKNETLSLFLAAVITIGFIFGGLWFFMERWAQINRIPKPSETGNTSNTSNPLNQAFSKCNVA
ncbi:MAG: phosphate ABC transporter substrate-binding protein, partial [Nostoc sp.]